MAPSFPISEVPLSEPVLYAAVFLFGAMVGSFLNVCIHRLPRDESIVRPRSKCPGCQNQIAWYDNVPVLSYLLLRGRCRSCGTKVSAVYPLVETLTGALAAALLYRFGPGPDGAIYFAFAAALVVITFIDLEFQIIPDVISIPGIPIGWVCAFLALEQVTLVDSLLGALLGGGILYAVASGYYFFTKREGMGGGDVKLLAMIGAFLGWKSVLFTLFAASLVGSVIGLLAAWRSGDGGKYAIPFGPFLAAGALVYVFWGQEILACYFGRF